MAGDLPSPPHPGDAPRTCGPRRTLARAHAVVHRFLVCEQGQDLLEYGLLAATVGIAGIGALQALTGVMGASYNGWNTQINLLWETPPPGS